MSDASRDGLVARLRADADIAEELITLEQYQLNHGVKAMIATIAANSREAADALHVSAAALDLSKIEVVKRKPGESHPLDRYREGVAQGRAEILALVAKLPPPMEYTNRDSNMMACWWCGLEFSAGTHPFSNDTHPANGCLFVRAQQAASEER